ncbi:MAG: hypothetical protein O7D91_00475 [Planctomycetota bacterium]|nr:hypothetical protein [Planctomycetota bacterium]
MVSSSKIAVVWQDDVQGFAVPVYRRIGGAGAFHDCVPSIIPTEEIQQDKYLGISGQHTAVLRPDGLLAVAWRSPLFDANIYCTVRRLFCRGDLDGDGTVDSGDLAILLGNWGSCEGCPADLNCDGEVDGADLAILLGNWGPCK